MSRKKTAYARNAVTGVATAAILEDQALVYDTAAGDDRVKPSTGGAGEKFAGFANMRAAIGQSVGVVQDGRATPIAAVDLVQGDLVKPAANGQVTVTTVAAEACGRADSSAPTGQRVTVEISGSY